MKTILLAALVIFSLPIQSQIHERCLGEAVEVAIAYKVSKIANGDCSNINKDEFMSIGEDRTNKKRFLKNAINGLNAGEKIPSRLFSSFEHTGVDVDFDKATICPVVSKRSELAVKDIMKDCPGGAELFQYMLGKQKETERVSDVSLSTVCHKVEELKAEACRDSKIVYRVSMDGNEAKDVDKAKIRAPSSVDGSSARASAQ